MDEQHIDINLLLYKRLLFEIKIMRESLQNIIDENIIDIQKNKYLIKQIQDKFYIISNNLYQM